MMCCRHDRCPFSAWLWQWLHIEHWACDQHFYVLHSDTVSTSMHGCEAITIHMITVIIVCVVGTIFNVFFIEINCQSIFCVIVHTLWNRLTQKKKYSNNTMLFAQSLLYSWKKSESHKTTQHMPFGNFNVVMRYVICHEPRTNQLSTI